MVGRRKEEDLDRFPNKVHGEQSSQLTENRSGSLLRECPIVEHPNKVL